MALAYLLMPYHLPEQFSRLVDRLLDGGDRAWVHLDAASDLAAFRARSSGVLDRPDISLVPRQRTAWGTYGFVAAILTGVRAALASGHPFSHLSLLSGQDYPIRPREELARLLAARPDDGFMSHFPLPGPGPGDELERVTHRFYRVAGRRFSLPNRYVSWPPPKEIPGGRRAYKGSAWWTLPRAMLQELVDTIDAEPGLIGLYRRSFCADESMIQTVLANGPSAARLDQDNLRSIVFDHGAYNPQIITVGDLPRLASSGAFFARKFHPDVDAEVLDRIDSDLLGVRAG